MAALRERVERQRSINTNILSGSESNSLEGLNLERGESQKSKRSVDKLDTQVSNLHQDVAALSVEVTNLHVQLIAKSMFYPCFAFRFVMPFKPSRR